MKPTLYHRCYCFSFLIFPYLLSSIKDIRKCIREMGELAGVPIEPLEQTKLLDICCFQAGVVGGGVPGGESLC